MAGPRPHRLRRRGLGEKERENFPEVVLISQMVFFRNMGKDWNSYLDYASSKTSFWTEPKVHDQHVIRTQELTEVKMN